MSNHTPEPCTCGPLPEPVNDDCPQHGERRIQACLNACAGIPTEQLGEVKALVEAAQFACDHDNLSASFSRLDAALAPFRKD